MPIKVDYSPSPSTYGNAMYQTGANLENYQRFKDFLQAMIQNKQLNQQYTMQQAQLAFQNKQLDRTNPIGSGFVYGGGGNGGGVTNAGLGVPQGFMDSRGWHSQ